MYIAGKHFILLIAVFFLLLALGIYLFRAAPAVITKVENSNQSPLSVTTVKKTETPKQEPPASQSQVVNKEIIKEISVVMATPWTNTDIQVNVGQTLNVTATGRGVWKSVPFSSPNAYPNPNEECGPDGTQPVDSRDYYSNIDYYQCPKAYKGALIGKVGDSGIPFLIGSKFSQKVSEGGNLYLGINDMSPNLGSDNWKDNRGSFLAKINVQ